MTRGIEFFIAGFAHCGAAALRDRLEGHPEVHVARRANPRVLALLATATDDQVRDWVRDEFASARNEAVRGVLWDALSQRDNEDACRWVAERFPEARILLVARDPFDRIDVAYRSLHTWGADMGLHCPFEIGTALRSFPAFLEEGRYGAVTEWFRSGFPDERIHVISLEALARDPGRTTADCLAFLGLTASGGSPAAAAVSAGESGYYDTERLRSLRDPGTNPETARALGRLKVDVLDQFLPQLGLRIPFDDDPIPWRPEDEATVVRALAADVQAFLDRSGGSLDDWPRFAAALRTHGVET